MKKFLLAMVCATILCSCAKEGMDVMEEPLKESMVYINLSSGNTLVKATGSGHGVQAEDNNIQTLEIFIFREHEGSDDDGVLDGYRKFASSELGNLTNLEIQTTTGRKIIYVVANSHRANWHGINNRELFEQQCAFLTNDDLKSFIMVGSKEVELELASTVNISISRLVSRIQIKSVKTAFAGGPWDGMALKDVKAYLTNVQAQKYIFNGLGNNMKILNAGKYMADDVSSCTMPGMLYDDFGADIGDSGYGTPHYFYSYSNECEEESDTEKFTRVVIQGTLGGTTYYYPIVLKELERNCCYTLDVTIRRPGSLTPDADVEKGTALACITVKDWDIADDSVVEF